MDDRELEPGAVLLGKYRIDEHIGVGGMGRVLRASHLQLDQAVAIKLLLPEMAESPAVVARFLREAQSTVRLKSEHTARVLDVGTLPDSTPFMIMEYLEGNDLNQILRHHGPQQPAVVVDLMLQACEGLAEAHALGIIHRDIKPSNFFITRRPDGSMLLKILDFGISKTPLGRGAEEELTGTQTVIGTPSYMAPEQMKSGRHADARSDIWSLGIVMYQLLMGRPPWAGESYSALVIKVNEEPMPAITVPIPQGMSDIIACCLEKSPHDRHQDVGELARKLAPFASEPASAAQTAQRATRTLNARGLGAMSKQTLPLAAGGGLTGLATPRSNPPRSWATSHGRGQMTERVGPARAWRNVAILALLVVIGVGGLIASRGGDEDEPTPATQPTTQPVMPMSVTPAPTPVAPPTPEPAPTPTPEPTPPEPTVEPAVEPAPKVEPAVAEPTTAEPTTAEPTKKSSKKKSSTRKKKRSSGGLFDSRH